MTVLVIIIFCFIKAKAIRKIRYTYIEVIFLIVKQGVSMFEFESNGSFDPVFSTEQADEYLSIERKFSKLIELMSKIEPHKFNTYLYERATINRVCKYRSAGFSGYKKYVQAMTELEPFFPLLEKMV